MAKKMEQFVHRQICAFCENEANSEEHYLGQWLDKIFVRGPLAHHTQTKAQVKGGPLVRSIQQWKDARRKNGNLITVRRKIVCTTCNNGWMSQIQDRASSILKKMILDEARQLAKEELSAVVSWATMVTMTFEFDDMPNMAITRSQRVYFKEHLTPPADWTIWLGMHVGTEWGCRLYHIGYKSHGIGEIPKPNGTVTAQSTMIALGHLDIFTACCNVPGVMDQSAERAEALTKVFQSAVIWPSQRDIDWQLLPVKGDADMDGNCNFFADQFEHNNLRNPSMVRAYATSKT